MSPTVLPTRAKAAAGLARPPRAVGVARLLRRRLRGQRRHDLLGRVDPYGPGRQRALSQGPALQRAHRRGRAPGPPGLDRRRCEVGRDGQRALSLTRRATAAPVRGMQVEACWGVPDQPARRRAELAEMAPGHYEARTAPLAEGNWLVALEVRAHDGRGADLPHAEAPMAQALTADRHLRAAPAHARAPVQARTLASTTTLAVEDMHCGGCMRKVEHALAAVAGRRPARAPTSRRRRVAAVHGAAGVNSRRPGRGARPRRLQGRRARRGQRRDRRRRADQALLKRVGVAGFAAANIMLLSVSVWSGAAGDMTPVGAGAVPLAVGADRPAGGRPMPASRSSARPRRRCAPRRLNMDVPISLGVTLATP